MENNDIFDRIKTVKPSEINDLNLENVNIDKPDYKSRTLLMYAAAWNPYEYITNTLIDVYGADLNIQDSNGLTALMLAAHHNNHYVIKSLINWEADITIKDVLGQTAWHHIQKNKNFDDKSQYKAEFDSLKEQLSTYNPIDDNTVRQIENLRKRVKDLEKIVHNLNSDPEKTQDKVSVQNSPLPQLRDTSEKEYNIPLEYFEKVLNGQNPVKVYRELRGYTVRQLANKTGFTPGFIYMIENDLKNGSSEVFKTIANVLELRVEDLVLPKKE